jgi:S-adenosylmethionine synthetase
VAHTNFLFTSESVSEGHPDKVCDQISDAVLDAFLANDIKLGIADDSLVNTRLGCETLTTTNKIVVAGEGRGQSPFFIKHGDKVVVNRELITEIARGVVKDIGYDQDGFSDYGSDVEVLLHGQSPDIAMGVNARKRKGGEEEGAGDQGLMFGFACKDTPELMPMPIALSHRILNRLAEARFAEEVDWLRPDSKSQVTIEYDGDRPVRIDTVVVSTQHAPDVENDEIRKFVIEQVIEKVLPADMLDDDIKYHINPTGKFVRGGPHGDCGLTGRKIIVDTYGGWGRHGGGAFSGTDPTKVDRSAAYMARHVAKNIVAAGLAERCEVQLAYAIGVSEPVSVHVETFGTGTVDDDRICEVVREFFPLTPGGIIDYLELRRPIYRKTAAGGHFGRDEPEFKWEHTDRAAELAEAAKGSVAAG